MKTRTKAKPVTWPVTIEALVQRVRRALRYRGQTLGRRRGKSCCVIENGHLVYSETLENLARNLGVLKSWESIE